MAKFKHKIIHQDNSSIVAEFWCQWPENMFPATRGVVYMGVLSVVSSEYGYLIILPVPTWCFGRVKVLKISSGENLGETLKRIYASPLGISSPESNSIEDIFRTALIFVYRYSDLFCTCRKIP